MPDQASGSGKPIPLPGGFVLYTFDTLGSTMDKAFDLAREGASHGTLVLTKKQTAGRGRRGTAWESLEGNIALSVVLRRFPEAFQPGHLSFMTCIAMGHALLAFLPQQDALSYKWPNDVLLDGKKVAGCLLEADLAASDPFIIAGVGVNLAASPKGQSFPVISLKEEGVGVLPEAFLSLFCTELRALHLDYYAQGFSFIQKAWNQRAWKMGHSMCAVQEGQEPLQGRVKGIDTQGRLILYDAAKGDQFVSAGQLQENKIAFTAKT